MINHRPIACLIATAPFFIASTSCDPLVKAIQAATAIFNNAIGQLTAQSEDWQKILRDTSANLTKDAGSLLTNEVDTVLARGIAASGAEARCSVDFVRARVRDDLIRLRDELTQNMNPAKIVLAPVVCSVVPGVGIEPDLVQSGRLSRLEVFGYDLDSKPLQILIGNGSATRDATKFFFLTSKYHGVLNLGANGVPIQNDDQKIEVMSGNEQLSVVPIIQPFSPKCQSYSMSVNLDSPTYKPPKTYGDGDFLAHPVLVSAKTSLSLSGNSIYATVYYKAKEDRDDWTTCEGQTTYKVYTASKGTQIKQIMGPLSSEYSGIISGGETTTSPEIAGPVQYFFMHGDGKGGDCADENGNAWVNPKFDPLKIELSQTDGCRP